MAIKFKGLKNLKEAYCPEIYDKRIIDEIVNIDDEEAFEMTRRLGKEEGLFVGMSSGAAMVIAAQKAVGNDGRDDCCHFSGQWREIFEHTVVCGKKES